MQSLTPYLTFIPDPDVKLTIADVAAMPAASFHPPAEFKGGFSKLVYWVKFTIDFRQYKEPYSYISKTYSHIGRVTLYQWIDGRYVASELDEKLPSSGRTLAVPDLLFRLDTPKGGVSTYFIRYEPRSHAVHLDLDWLNSQTVIEKTGELQLSYGLLFGCFGALWLYNFFVLLVTRDVAYLYYVYYLGCLALVMTDLDGFASIALDLTPEQSKIFVLLLYASMHGGTLFCRSFFSLKQFAPMLDKGFLGCMWLMLAGAIGTLFIPVGTGYQIAILFIPVMALLIAMTGIVRWRQGFEPALFSMIGMVILGIFTTTYVLRLYNVIPASKITALGTQIGTLCESLLLAFALGYRIKLAENEAKRLIEKQRFLLLAEQKAVAEAQAATAGKNAFLGMISHELRTPMQGVISSLDLLATMKLDDKPAEVVGRLASSANQLDVQMRDLTDFARLESGKGKLEIEECDVARLIRGSVEKMRSMAENKGLSLNIEMPDEGAIVLSDAVRIEQIANNLISNAIKYTNEGRVDVAVAFEHIGPELWLIIKVADTGIGIEAKNRELIFEPFVQLDRQSKRRREGVGIGLAIVKQLVELFEGSVEVDSVVDVGSKFIVRIPVQEATAAIDSKVMQSSVVNASAMTILVVDDTRDVLRSLREVVEFLQYGCETAENGSEALKKLSAKKYDAILLDINMPDIDGFSVASSIRSGGGLNQRTPIVWISAIAPQMMSEEQKKLFSYFLRKPVRMKKLDELLKTILG